MTKRRRKRVPVQFDAYGIKTTVTPGDSGRRPSSWRQVALRVNRHLMSLCDGAVGLFPDTVQAVRNIVRGIGGIPDALAKRIAGAHRRADKAEARRQAEVATVSVTSAGSTEPIGSYAPAPLEKLEEIFHRLRIRGVHVEFIDLGGGKLKLIAVQPEAVEKARALGLKTPADFDAIVYAFERGRGPTPEIRHLESGTVVRFQRELADREMRKLVSLLKAAGVKKRLLEAALGGGMTTMTFGNA